VRSPPIPSTGVLYDFPAIGQFFAFVFFFFFFFSFQLHRGLCLGLHSAPLLFWERDRQACHGRQRCPNVFGETPLSWPELDYARLVSSLQFFIRFRLPTPFYFSLVYRTSSVIPFTVDTLLKLTKDYPLHLQRFSPLLQHSGPCGTIG